MRNVIQGLDLVSPQTKSPNHTDLRNALGERVASGIYFYQLTTPSFQQTRRLVIVK
ncbi:MAG: T9SS type A sorting domain-containing protein [Candidatus Poribacteria bacterium]|nr:T9SS type A sorting domain-containing protein [Candidatus Poribacteria bacterium]